MSTERVVASHLRIALSGLEAAAALADIRNRHAAEMLFQGAENLLVAVLILEGIDPAEVRRSSGNHQLSRYIDALPDACCLKIDLRKLEELTAFATTFRYPTPGGRIPPSPRAEQIKEWAGILGHLIREVSEKTDVSLEITDDTPAGKLPVPRWR